MRFVLSREDDGLTAADQMPRQRSTNVACSDDCGCHGDSFPLLDTATNEAYSPNIPTANRAHGAVRDAAAAGGAPVSPRARRVTVRRSGLSRRVPARSSRLPPSR